MNQVQSTNETRPYPPGIDNTETSELQLNHIHFESTDDKSDTKSTLIINKFETNHEYKKPIESNYYKNDSINFQETKNSQATMNYTPHTIEKISSLNNVYQKTTNKVPTPQKKWIIPILLEA